MNSGMLTVAPSPHIHQELSVPKVMQGVIIALVPALLVSIYTFGLSALWITALAIASSMLFEFLIVKYLFKRDLSITDGSAIITGILIAFNLPPSIPWHLVVIGSAVGIGIGKLSFGGLGNNPFNPALVARVFLLISFPVPMTYWALPRVVDGTSGATPLGILKEGLRDGQTVSSLMDQMPGLDTLFLGIQSGSLGEMSALAMLLGLGYMLYRKIITWHIPITMLATIFALTGIFWLINPEMYASPVFHLVTGGVMLGAVFMATDYVTSPVSKKGMMIFAFGIGLITVVIRLFGSYPEGVSFAILIMNAFVPLINKYFKPRRYGVARESREKQEKVVAENA